MKFPKIKISLPTPILWWKTRHYRKLKKCLRYLNGPAQLGVAQGIIATMAANQPRSKRRGFLVIQGDQIAEITKLAVERRGVNKLELL